MAARRDRSVGGVQRSTHVPGSTHSRCSRPPACRGSRWLPSFHWFDGADAPSRLCGGPGRRRPRSLRGRRPSQLASDVASAFCAGIGGTGWLQQ
jgi:hypothetical protein